MVKYNFTYDLVFKAALEACPSAAIKLIKEFVSDLKDISSFNNLSKTKLEMTNNAIICTTKSIYSIGKGVYVIPFTSI